MPFCFVLKGENVMILENNKLYNKLTLQEYQENIKEYGKSSKVKIALFIRNEGKVNKFISLDRIKLFTTVKIKGEIESLTLQHLYVSIADFLTSATDMPPVFVRDHCFPNPIGMCYVENLNTLYLAFDLSITHNLDATLYNIEGYTTNLLDNTLRKNYIQFIREVLEKYYNRV